MPDTNTAFWISLILMTVVLLWGLGLIARALLGGPSGDAREPLIRSMLSEPADQPAKTVKGSFSRTAGAFGAMGLAASVVGISYWVIFDLFSTNGDNLGKLKDVGWFFLAGSALFAPYAFNRLSKLFGAVST
ncbi:hypothetical protein [Roseomonas indoligenes]|uniref:Uncharacterized protein n=1 Tax=Roseomonas indoligenes TaxID=2820811 RepID=A0A940N4V4_9PROT|nr:hypothetical protein [Pararoseomonas indoligenes]MBP0496006.1 hypothetical protein [Pararoseomonas indoligenes]